MECGGHFGRAYEDTLFVQLCAR